MAPREGDTLNVVALISGGKDSFFSLLHCQANGHNVVALANLYPPRNGNEKDERGEVTAILPGQQVVADDDGEKGEEEEEDLNSFMYQTVGHKVIPLYADATGLPLYRRAITGGAGGSGRDYAPGEEGDETESMTHLLKAVMEVHPEVNAVCSGAVLSNYQRTRVESVATRLNLTPLAFLWQYPVLNTNGGTYLPGKSELVGYVEGGEEDDARLLDDMRLAGLDARIIKVASGALDETFLGLNVASKEGGVRLRKAMRRFGGGVRGSGAMIGEGGEYETLVVDGPSQLFKKRIVVEKDGGMRIVREGGGAAWWDVRKARLEQKSGEEDEHRRTVTVPADPAFGETENEEVGLSPSVRIPNYRHGARSSSTGLDAFAHEIPEVWAAGMGEKAIGPEGSYICNGSSQLKHWCVIADASFLSSIKLETHSVVAKIRALLEEASLSPTAILNTVVVLRDMDDFATVNSVYRELFTEPNPPSRVCIACGDALPSRHNIVVYLSVHTALEPRDREGLHVQSRSYWAPANIGPYSQAISVPVASLSPARNPTLESSTETRMVQIAGQIELDPGKMVMDLGDNSVISTYPLAIQHLWHIADAVGVQWWSSGVAYLPKDKYEEHNEVYAAQTWRRMHIYCPEKDMFDSPYVPDAWDRRNIPTYMSYSSPEEDPKECPDMAVLDSSEKEEEETLNNTPMPAFIVAQVDTLPRRAGIEFHAHIGFSNVSEGSVRIMTSQSELMQVHHTIIDMDDKGTFVHTVLTVRHQPESSKKEKMALESVLDELSFLYLARMAALAGKEAAQALSEVTPTHLYANTKAITVAPEDIGRAGCPVVPCYNLWVVEAGTDKLTREVTAVGVYQTLLERKRL
jgi:diphthine-ammonia ligase